tara:strand:+ start:6512 stop:6913 length:402 start_codon:yes stop_codon:yes gene_type:complete
MAFTKIEPVGLNAGINTTFVSAVGIQSASAQIGTGITQINFIGTGNQITANGTTVDVKIAGGGGSGENVVGETGFLKHVLSVANVGVVETNSTIEPVTGDDFTYVKFQEVKVNSNMDLIIASGDFIIDIYDLS